MKHILLFLPFSLLLVACDYFICSSKSYVSSLKNCGTYKCLDPLMGISYDVGLIDNSICKIKFGFADDNVYMQCQASAKEHIKIYEQIHDWAYAEGQKQATYHFSRLDVEYFVEGQSLGKPYYELVENGKCEYIKKP